eukprot:TRINITY_DN2944_c0_g2_i1.p1 TRINITY_DN2944_c0_g2~~TRINITY_DN2944_c0_g2_i1.p1  ORF type:complete len:1954 (+),score=558.59 TRINITY_DN2944_c0_g2_i1:111-5864(+)
MPTNTRCNGAARQPSAPQPARPVSPEPQCVTGPPVTTAPSPEDSPPPAHPPPAEEPPVRPRGEQQHEAGPQQGELDGAPDGAAQDFNQTEWTVDGSPGGGEDAPPNSALSTSTDPVPSSAPPKQQRHPELQETAPTPDQGRGAPRGHLKDSKRFCSVEDFSGILAESGAGGGSMMEATYSNFNPAVLGRSITALPSEGRAGSPFPPGDSGARKLEIAASDMSQKIFSAGEQAYHRVRIVGDNGGNEMQQAAVQLHATLDIRQRYAPSSWPILPSFAPVPHVCDHRESAPDAADLNQRVACELSPQGVVSWAGADAIPGWDDFAAHLDTVYVTVEDGPCRSSCKGRLRLLETKFRMHCILNGDLEDFAAAASGRAGGGGALGSCVRVDGRTRLATAAQARLLVKEARRAVAVAAARETRVAVREVEAGDGPPALVPCTCHAGGRCHPEASATVAGILRNVGITPEDLTVERLALQYSAQLSDPISLLYPCEKGTRPRGVAAYVMPLLLTPSAGADRMASFISRQFDAHTAEPGGSAAEYSIFVSGCHRDELRALAVWLRSRGLLRAAGGGPYVRFFLELRQPPAGAVASYADWLGNIFLPLAEASCPGAPADDPVGLLLLCLGGVVLSSGMGSHLPLLDPCPPKDWPMDQEPPPFTWLLYHVWANVRRVSHLRRSCGLRGLELRPRCGDNLEDFRSLCACFLLADAVLGGIQLTHSAVLQYLYYTCQIPVHMCPSSASIHKQVPSISDHPFPVLYRRGLRVILGTDDPLLQQCGGVPLEEEYRQAVRMWCLTAADVGELSRTSVMFSSFESGMKRKWLGSRYNLGFRGNSSKLSSVPTIRLVFRDMLYQQEVRVLARCCLNAAQETIAPTVSPSAATRQLAWCRILTPTRRHSYGSSLEPSPDTAAQSQAAASGLAAPAAPPRRPSGGASPGEERSPGSKLLGAELAAGGFARRPSHLGSLNRMFGSGNVSVAKAGVEQARHEAEQFVEKYGQYAVPEEAEPYVMYHRIEISGPPSQRYASSATALVAALQMRKRYQWQLPEPWAPREPPKIWGKEQGSPEFVGGLPTLRDWQPRGGSITPLEDFCSDMRWLQGLTADSQIRAFAERRLELLEYRFALHTALNALNENHATDRCRKEDCADMIDDGDDEDDAAQKDFYRAYKVDTHVHMAAGMTARMLLDFMKNKYDNHGDDICKVDPAGRVVTLKRLLTEMNVDMLQLSVNMLNVQADATLFERFDNFNSKYNPLGKGELREVFLKTDNFMGGRYFAELIRNTFDRYAALDPRSFSEMRLSIYGRRRSEWNALARWSSTFGMIHRQNKWMIQIPRIYNVWHKIGAVRSFGEMLLNIFEPLWEVSLDPCSDPTLAFFLEHVSGFDSVDNEAAVDPPLRPVRPDDWTSPHNPPYAYWMYYLWANVTLLNQFRAEHGQSTFALRPHAGEAGDLAHLSACFLTVGGIAHGINLAKNSVLEYLYYLARIPLYVSPLSNNSLFLEYVSNPFPRLFRRGLFVSLSTDDPLQFHHTAEPLIEEYSVASKVWRLSTSDLCEIARNSVLHSGFEHERKKAWIGDTYFMDSSRGNQADLTHVDDIRVTYRYETYHEEIKFLQGLNQAKEEVPSAMLTLEEEDAIMASPWFARTASRKKSRTMAVTGDLSSRRSVRPSTASAIDHTVSVSAAAHPPAPAQAPAPAPRAAVPAAHGPQRLLSPEGSADAGLLAENRRLRQKLQELELHLEVMQTLHPTSPFSDAAVRASMRRRRASSLLEVPGGSVPAAPERRGSPQDDKLLGSVLRAESCTYDSGVTATSTAGGPQPTSEKTAGQEGVSGAKAASFSELPPLRRVSQPRLGAAAVGQAGSAPASAGPQPRASLDRGNARPRPLADAVPSSPASDAGGTANGTGGAGGEGERAALEPGGPRKQHCPPAAE